MDASEEEAARDGGDNSNDNDMTSSGNWRPVFVMLAPDGWRLIVRSTVWKLEVSTTPVKTEEPIAERNVHIEHDLAVSCL